MKKRIGIVTPWYGRDATGGAESLARELARKLSQVDDVVILTTCSRSFLSEWDENYYIPGTTSDGSYSVMRFPVDPRAKALFDAANAALLQLPPECWDDLRARPDATKPFIEESINSTPLEEYLRHTAPHRFDAVVFLPYLFGVIVRGIEAYPGPVHLLPCLHDEAYARLPRIEDAFHRASTILANSAGEAELALRIYGPGIVHKLHVIGSGIEMSPTEGTAALPAAVRSPFLLYVGRRDVTKNVDQLVRAQRRYRSNGSRNALSLVLVGPGTQSYADPAAGIIDLGFVDEPTKAALLDGAVALVQPSINESYSRVLMEAWLRRKPVAVHASCLATATAVHAAKGGLLASTDDEWVNALFQFDRGDDDQLRALGRSGEQYAKEHADWENVLDRLRAATGLKVPQRSRRRHRRIDQFVQTLEYGDAISDYAVNIRQRLHTLGYESTIYAESIGPLVADEAVPYDPERIDRADAIIYHHSIASAGTQHIVASSLRRALVYHNITPAEFFRPYSESFAELLEIGRRQTTSLMHSFDVFVADSEFNARELIDMGAASVKTIPVVVGFSRFDCSPNRAILAKRSRGIHVLFVGRVAPNKGLTMLIDTFEAYRCFDENAALTIVGRYSEMDPYYRQLKAAVIDRGLDDAVKFVGIIAEADLLSYYQSADLYVCLSEHEGFCVPLVEAMYFDIPIIALATTAIPETLGQGGLLIEPGTDCIEIAAAMHAVCTDRSLRLKLIDAQRERRQFYRPDISEKRIDGLVEALTS